MRPVYIHAVRRSRFVLKDNMFIENYDLIEKRTSAVAFVLHRHVMKYMLSDIVMIWYVFPFRQRGGIKNNNKTKTGTRQRGGIGGGGEQREKGPPRAIDVADGSTTGEGMRAAGSAFLTLNLGAHAGFAFCAVYTRPESEKTTTTTTTTLLLLLLVLQSNIPLHKPYICIYKYLLYTYGFTVFSNRPPLARPQTLYAPNPRRLCTTTALPRHTSRGFFSCLSLYIFMLTLFRYSRLTFVVFIICFFNATSFFIQRYSL